MQDRKPASQSRLQQQPQRVMNRQQQQSSGSREFQPKQGRNGECLPGQLGGSTERQRGSPGASSDAMG